MARARSWRFYRWRRRTRSCSLAAPASAEERQHGLSAFGDLAYPADFKHFAYANPDAPKGGTFSLIGWGGVTTFNSLNNYILKGDAGAGARAPVRFAHGAGRRRT